MATAREEAERLVAATLAAAQFATRAARRNVGTTPRDARESGNELLEDLAGLANMASKFLGSSGLGTPASAPQTDKHHVIATGSAECCICPVCRAIAAVRDPSPEFAERLATGASDLAAGVTSILRAFGEATRRAGRPDQTAGRTADEIDGHALVDTETAAPAHSVPERVDDAAGPPVEAPEPSDSSGWPSWSDFGSVWQAATRVQDEPVRPAGDSGPVRPATKKTVAKKAVAKKTVAKQAVAKKAVAKKTVAKKTVAKKAVSQAAAGEPAAAEAKPAKAAAAKKTPGKAAAHTTTAKKAAQKTTAKKAGQKTTAKKAVRKTTPPASEPKKAQ